MARSKEQPTRSSTGGIPLLFVIWLLSIIGAALCYLFVDPTGTSKTSATYGLNRALTIVGLAALAAVGSIISVVKTCRRRRHLSKPVKSMGYSPFCVTLASVGTLLHRIISGEWLFGQ